MGIGNIGGFSSVHQSMDSGGQQIAVQNATKTLQEVLDLLELDRMDLSEDLLNFTAALKGSGKQEASVLGSKTSDQEIQEQFFEVEDTIEHHIVLEEDEEKKKKKKKKQSLTKKLFEQLEKLKKFTSMLSTDGLNESEKKVVNDFFKNVASLEYLKRREVELQLEEDRLIKELKQSKAREDRQAMNGSEGG